jgi:hypothetical protein
VRFSSLSGADESAAIARAPDVNGWAMASSRS